MENSRATEIAKLLYDNSYEMYLNSNNSVEKSYLSECIDELKVILELSPNIVPSKTAKVFLDFLAKIYVPSDLVNFWIQRKSTEFNSTTYTITEMPNRMNTGTLRSFGVIVEENDDNFTAGIIISTEGK